MPDDPLSQDQPGDARLIALGSADLVLGFGLIGFETVPEATPEDVERVVSELLEARQPAFVLLEADLAASGSPALARARARGGRIVVAELPKLGESPTYRSPVEELVAQVLGPRLLESES